MTTMMSWETAIGGIEPSPCGARIGDGIGALPLEHVTLIAPNNHWLRRIWRGGALYRLSATGDEIRVTRDELIAELRKCGGYVELGDRSYELLDGCVRSITFRPEALTLPLLEERQIVERLGPPQGIELRGDVCIYHHRAWSLLVTWDRADKKLIGITLGARGPIPGVFGAQEVLYEWLKMTWYPGERTREVQQRRAEALLRAFDLGTVKDFEWGRFLNGRRVEEFPRLAAMISPLPEKERREFDVTRFFFVLLRHLKAVQQLARATAFDAISGPAMSVALSLVGRTQTRLWGALTEEEALLFELISPDDRRISEPDLVSQWGFPTENLLEIIADEW